MIMLDEKQELALFKYGIIAPVLNDTMGKQNQYFNKLSKKTHNVPGIGQKKYHPSTFKSWLRKYRKRGFDGLYKSCRKDKGKPRKITEEIAVGIINTIRDYQVPSYSELYRKLVQQGYFDENYIKYQAIRVYMQNNNIKLKPETITSCKKFEAEHINLIWLSDYMHGPYLKQGKKKRKAILCAIIDDRSRVIVGYNWSFHENILSLLTAFKKALLTYGLCTRFYCDNGPSFVSSHLNIVCARLGVSLIHSKPYVSIGRGKIERFNRTVRQMFLPSFNTENATIDDLNEDFQSWLKNSYHKSIHKGINMAPLDRFMNDIKNTKIKRISEDEIEQHFLVTVKRKVKNDSTVSFEGILYEVPAKFIGSNIEIRYPVYDQSRIFLYENNKSVFKLKKVDVHENERLSTSSISFTSM